MRFYLKLKKAHVEPPEAIRADTLELARFALGLGAVCGVIVFDGTGTAGGARAAIYSGIEFVEVTENGDRRDLLER